MRILYDGFIYSAQAAGGVSRYFSRLISRLPENATPVLLSAVRRALDFPQHPRLELLVVPAPAWPKPLRGISRRLGRSRARHAFARMPADIVHPTYYRLLGGCDLRRERRPVVVTVYDMIHERFAPLVDPRGEQAAEKRRAILSAAAVICISESTKRDLLELVSLPEDRVWVTPLASDIQLVQPSAPAVALRQPFFLHVGSRAPYKNFDRLLQAVSEVARRFPDVQLCVVGQPFSLAERQQIAALQLEPRVQHLGLADDRVLAWLYREAVALVYPSLYEGFGIPPLEALCCGGVVVAANTSSIPEVVGDAGRLFDPFSVDDLAAQLTDLLERPEQRAEWLQRGQARAAKFSWERTAAQTWKIYDAVLSETTRRRTPTSTARPAAA